METKSSVKDASSPSPCSRISNEKKVTATMKNGERRIAIVRGIPLGASSKSTLTTKNPAAIDSTNCSSQTMSFGRPPANALSSIFSEPMELRVPRKLASMNSRAAMISLRVPLGNCENCSRASCSMLLHKPVHHAN